MPPKKTTPPDPAARLQSAIHTARAMNRILRAGRADADQLAQATLLQGIVAGDVIAASILTRLKLQKENLRLRQRLAVQKLRESEAREHLIREETRKLQHTPSPAEVSKSIREIYGLNQITPAHQIPETTENHQKTGPQMPQDAPEQSS